MSNVEQYSDIRSTFCILWGVVLGAITFSAVWGWSVIDPTHVNWLMAQDSATHFLGWHFFRSEPWTFPLGAIKSYGYPEGTSVVFTDSIPLVAIPLKLFNLFLPRLFQYKGLWMLFVYCFQGVAAAFLLAKFTRHKLLLGLGTFIFIIAPPLFIRTRCQESLASQGIILAAFCLYLNEADIRNSGKWVGLLVAAVLIHFYLFVMAAAIYSAYVVKTMLNASRQQARMTGCFYLFTLGLVAVVMWAAGYFVNFTGLSGVAAMDYGRYPLNLLSIINPSPWKTLLSVPVTTGISDIEVNYLGLGVMLALLYGGVTAWKHRNDIALRAYIPLFGVCLFLVVFAMTNRVTIADHVFVVFSLPTVIQRLFSIVRASDRFFWPFYYLLVLFAILSIIRFHKYRQAAILLVFCVLIQVVDLWPFYNRIVEGQVTSIWETPLRSSLWHKIIGRVKHICFVPPVVTGETYVPFAYLAANNGRTTDVSYSAHDHFRPVHYFSVVDMARSGRYATDTLYVFHGSYLYPPMGNAARKVMWGSLDGYQIVAPMIPQANMRPWPFISKKNQKPRKLGNMLPLLAKKGNAAVVNYKNPAGAELPLPLVVILSKLDDQLDVTGCRGSFRCIIADGRIVRDSVRMGGGQDLGLSFNWSNFELKISPAKYNNPYSRRIFINSALFASQRSVLDVIVLDKKDKEVQSFYYPTVGNADNLSLPL